MLKLKHMQILLLVLPELLFQMISVVPPKNKEQKRCTWIIDEDFYGVLKVLLASVSSINPMWLKISYMDSIAT